MTQPSPPDRGALRAAVEGLLRTCVDLELQADGVAEQSRARVRRVTTGLAGVRLPSRAVDVTALAQQVDSIGRQLNADLDRQLTEARQPYVAEIHALLALLAPMHGFGTLPVLAAAPPDAGLAERFPTGFARTYVEDLLTGVGPGLRLEPADAAQCPTTSPDELAAAKETLRAAFGITLADDGMELLTHEGCHAVERHGPHIAGHAQLARLLWLKDPAGQQVWHLEASGGRRHRASLWSHRGRLRLASRAGQAARSAARRSAAPRGWIAGVLERQHQGEGQGDHHPR